MIGSKINKFILLLIKLQVKEMFGDRPDLILPLALDIANLIRLAGTTMEEKSKLSYKEKEFIPANQLLRRSFQVTPKANRMDTAKIVQSSYMSNDQLHLDEEDVLKIKTRDLVRAGKSHNPDQKIRQKRSYHEKTLNMTDFNGAGDQLAMASDGGDEMVSYDLLPTYLKDNLTLEEIEKLAFAAINGTDFDKLETTQNNNTTLDENLPTPEMLIGGYYRPKIIKLSQYIRQRYPNPNSDRVAPCEKFGNVCLRTADYPM